MGAYGADGWSTAAEEQALGLDTPLWAENEIQRRLEERAEEEIGGPEFREWLAIHVGENASPNGGGGIALILCAIDWEHGRKGALDALGAGVRALLSDWITYRVETMDEWTRSDIVKSVLEPSDD